jgi:hypothetical protein
MSTVLCCRFGHTRMLRDHAYATQQAGWRLVRNIPDAVALAQADCPAARS